MPETSSAYSSVSTVTGRKPSSAQSLYSGARLRWPLKCSMVTWIVFSRMEAKVMSSTGPSRVWPRFSITALVATTEIFPSCTYSS